MAKRTNPINYLRIESTRAEGAHPPYTTWSIASTMGDGASPFMISKALSGVDDGGRCQHIYIGIEHSRLVDYGVGCFPRHTTWSMESMMAEGASPR
jgi:hypothetical protein